MNSNELIALEDQYGAHNYHPLDVVLERGDGVWVFDTDGNKYLDCLSAYSALSHGHVHPRILKALITQASQLTLTSRAFRNNQLPIFYKKLNEILGYDMALPMNTGAEAVETAIKLARKWAYIVKKVPRYEAEIITATSNFHGRTISIISFSTESLYKQDFGPYTPGFITVEYGNSGELERAINQNTAAVLLEPIQGEAGVIIPPDGYVNQVAEICKKHGILFIADEIQTGLGRTGKMFACDHENVRPDIMIIGKALGGGFYPVSAILANSSILGLFKPGEHGSTFGGNPLAAAVAISSLETLVDDHLIENAASCGEYFLERLQEIPSKVIKEVRGKGLLIGIEIKSEYGLARNYVHQLMQRGILAKDTHEKVIRFAPPLIIDRDTIDWAIPRIQEVLQS